jgi:hypothetical protein
LDGSKEKHNRDMIPTIKYFWLTVKHKWFVFLAGIKIGCPLWRLLTHDLSKFSRRELKHYGRQFFGKADRPYDFIKCWIHHQNHNDHHWEYWIPRTGHNRCKPPYPDGKPIRMPDGAVLEMIADWCGASRAYEGFWPWERPWYWFDANYHTNIKPKLHNETSELIEKVLLEKFSIIPSNLVEEMKNAISKKMKSAISKRYRSKTCQK